MVDFLELSPCAHDMLNKTLDTDGVSLSFVLRLAGSHGHI